MDPLPVPGGAACVDRYPHVHGRRGLAPVMFDLTTVQRPRPPEPTVYYLVPEVPTRDRPSTWCTVAGFGGVISVGLGLGLLLARLLLV